MNKYLTLICGINGVDPNSVIKFLGEDDEHYLRAVVGDMEYRLMLTSYQYPIKRPKIVGKYIDKDINTEEVIEDDNESDDIKENDEKNNANEVIDNINQISKDISKDNTLFKQESTEKRGRGRPKTK
jgi:hypothetical protein